MASQGRLPAVTANPVQAVIANPVAAATANPVAAVTANPVPVAAANPVPTGTEVPVPAAAARPSPHPRKLKANQPRVANPGRRMFGSRNFRPEQSRGLPKSSSARSPSRAWAALSLCVAPLLTPWQAHAAPGGAEPRTFFSQSGQFIVRGFPVGAPLSSGVSTAAVTYARLDPALLAVSCERIKQALLGTLGMADGWRGTISILSHPVREDNEPIVVRAVRYADGWTYHLVIPEQVDKGRLIEALTQVLLQEIANRRPGPQAAELPPWLAVRLGGHRPATGHPTR